MGQVHGGPRVALILPVSPPPPPPPSRHLRCALSLSLETFPSSCTCHRIHETESLVIGDGDDGGSWPLLVDEEGLKGLRRSKKNCGAKRMRRGWFQRPTLSSLPSLLFDWSRGGSLSIRNLGQWNENGTRAPIHRPGASSVPVCAPVHSSSTRSRMLYRAVRKNRRWRPSPRGEDVWQPLSCCSCLLFLRFNGHRDAYSFWWTRVD